ncbi:asparaginase [Lederbergia wuyishanensis]|uniref:L-asparaginase II n=1 Tax=Lederbergia wuyishanensis TaxID=1347903 RepID=A0ABU0D8E0_9BACI|nr:asparaginase [Lederbergia wuyishanensis]MCJ8009218.1 asparaginase [Lederbergia wuyishanensis]MDQ0344652.1 L-asparaginase II [Lederbergia wuyishanensis]
MQYEVLIEETRNGLVENIHTGIICGVNDQLQSIYQIGDEEQYVYYRSASKPIQAIPIFLSNIIEKYNITDEEAALFTASQRGETYHIAALESLLQKLPANEEELFCPASYPLNAVPKEAMIREQKSKRRLYHNCAGKHLGFVTMCRELGFPVEGYWEESHPLQQKILGILSELSEVPQSKIKTGVDGCGVPVFAIPLKNMAITYLKLACPDLIKDEDMQKAVKKMTHVMNLHPNIVASEDFVCSALLRDENIVAKGGAQGVYCFGLKKERIGFALKVLTGSEDVWPNVLASILEQIGYNNQQTISSLRKIRPAIIKNDAGIIVGEVKEKFSL